MLKKIRTTLILLCSMFLLACTTTTGLTTVQLSNLQQGKRLFEAGMYKRAKVWLMPLAVDGVAEAQYAIGYMYYYGYGVTQDTETGYFWIRRSADQHYLPAQKALKVVKHQGGPI